MAMGADQTTAFQPSAATAMPAMEATMDWVELTGSCVRARDVGRGRGMGVGKATKHRRSGECVAQGPRKVSYLRAMLSR